MASLSHQTPPTPQTTAESVPQSPLNSPARPINPPEQWYAPTSPLEHRRRSSSSTNAGSSSRTSPEGNASAAPPPRPRPSASTESTLLNASRLVEAKAPTTTTATAVDGLRDGAAAEAYWRACASELGPGEAWYAQAADGRETGGQQRREKQGGGSSQKGKGVVEAADDEEKGGTREFGPGVEWYLGLGTANWVVVS